jgi:hypothetical protein
MPTRDLFNDALPPCPLCSSGEFIPIIYTTPSDEMRTAAELGLIVLGNSQDREASPQWKCKSGSCDYRF